MRVEFRRPTEDGRYEVAAVIDVDGSGIVTTTGPDVAIITAIAVPHPEAAGQRIRFADDPAGWVRNAPHGFRSRFLVPVTTS